MTVTGPRITELANALTTHIDVGAPLDIMRMLRAVDGEMFAAEGVGGAPGPTAASVAAIMEAAAEHVRRVISLPDGDDAGGGGGGLVVFSGSGTSGRLGFLAARAYNAALAARGRRHRFAYLIAGGDAALLKAQENVEDDAGVAVADLAALLDASRPSAAVLVGISCGLTATYVGAQLDYARTRCAAARAAGGGGDGWWWWWW
jgi:N-acetylmuramic acid 6-phosphate (MurNAc-6-P) etherase